MRPSGAIAENPEAHHVLAAILFEAGRMKKRPPNTSRFSASAPITPKLAPSWLRQEEGECKHDGVRIMRRAG